MFSRFRGSGGSYTLLAGGLALLALAGFTALTPIGGLALALSAGLAVAGVSLLWTAVSRARTDRYDLGRLFDTPAPEPEEPLLDEVPEDEIGAPYCGWCDEAYAPGTRRCHRCGRDL